MKSAKISFAVESKFCRGEVSFALADMGHRKFEFSVNKFQDAAYIFRMNSLVKF